MKRLSQTLPIIIICLTLFGVLDAGYLTYEHYAHITPPCSIHWWISDCGLVLGSKYSTIIGIPLALLGILQYTAEFVMAIIAYFTKQKWVEKILIIQSTGGLLASTYFVYLMVIVIRAVCLYCFGSAIISMLLFALILVKFASSSNFWNRFTNL